MQLVSSWKGQQVAVLSIYSTKREEEDDLVTIANKLIWSVMKFSSVNQIPRPALFYSIIIYLFSPSLLNKTQHLFLELNRF